MSKKKLAALIVTVMLIMLVGCSSSDSYNTAEGKGLFAKIEIDYSKTLTTNTNLYHYYYLKDTGVVYVGFISSIGYGNSDTITQVISPNGNYYLYDVKEQMVVEIVDENLVLK